MSKRPKRTISNSNKSLALKPLVEKLQEENGDSSNSNYDESEDSDLSSASSVESEREEEDFERQRKRKRDVEARLTESNAQTSRLTALQLNNPDRSLNLNIAASHQTTSIIVERDLAKPETIASSIEAPSLPVSKIKPKKKKAEKIEFTTIHPDLTTIWIDLAGTRETEEGKESQPTRMIVKLLPFQLEGLRWMKRQEESADYHGGILADVSLLNLTSQEMGMGKTIQMISLIVSSLDLTKPNLILCPAVALMQWKSELEKRTIPGLLNVLLHHGSNRATKVAELEGFHVVLTTYAILEHGFRKQTYGTKEKGMLVKRSSLLHKVNWFRFILDEAHAIKDRYSSTARACFAINSERQWCLSGTPLQNRVGELFSLIRLMDLYPHSYYFCTRCPCKMQSWKFSDHIYCDECGHTGHQHFCYWNREILKPIQKFGSTGDGAFAFKKLASVLDKIMLRRTKIQRNDELGLPPRIVECRRDIFNEAEEELYESLYSETTRVFSTYANAGSILNNYVKGLLILGEYF